PWSVEQQKDLLCRDGQRRSEALLCFFGCSQGFGRGSFGVAWCLRVLFLKAANHIEVVEFCLQIALGLHPAINLQLRLDDRIVEFGQLLRDALVMVNAITERFFWR